MLEEKQVSCPYCGEQFTTAVNPEDCGNTYIEDCFVCCRPITFIISEGWNGNLQIETRDENDC